MDSHQKNQGRRRKHTNRPKNNNDKSTLEELLKNILQGAGNILGIESISNIGQPSKEEHTVSSDIAGDFEIYLFAQVWAPRFCCTKQKQCKEEQNKNDLTVHGLWPAYQSPRQAGLTYPSYCNNYVATKSKDKLAIHEWKKHGTCTSLTFDQYITESIKIESDDENINSLRDYLNDNAGGTVKIDDIFQYVGGNKKIAVMSNKYCQLQEITTCFSKNQDGTIDKQIDCPKHVLASSRNSAVLNGCKQLALDSIEANKCRYITKELLNKLKSTSVSNEI
jgi:ribonuclease T2